MPRYLYRATDARRKRLTGEIEGEDRGHAEARLIEQGLLIETLDVVETVSDEQNQAVNRAELVELVEQLAALTRSGLPLPSGLRASAEETTSTRLRSTFFQIADLVESGEGLDEALSKTGGRFPPELRGLIAAGSRTGKLAEMLAQYVRCANLGSELRRLFFLKLAYPTLALILVVALVGALCALSIRAVEGLTGALRDFGGSQPTMARGLIGMTQFINDHGFEILIIGIAIPMVTWVAFQLCYGPAQRRRILCAVPVLGPVLRFTSLTEFCHILAMLIEAETPLPRAFELAGASVRDPEVAEACRAMGRAIEGGETLSLAMRRWPTVPAGLGQLFRWSEDRDRLPDALHLAGEMFEARARSQSSYASQVAATFVLLLVLWWLGFAIAAVYLPFFSLIQMISRLSG